MTKIGALHHVYFSKVNMAMSMTIKNVKGISSIHMLIFAPTVTLL